MERFTVPRQVMVGVGELLTVPTINLLLLGYLPIANSPAEHTQQFRDMIARWTDVIDRANIKIE